MAIFVLFLYYFISVLFRIIRLNVMIPRVCDSLNDIGPLQHSPHTHIFNIQPQVFVVWNPPLKEPRPPSATAAQHTQAHSEATTTEPTEQAPEEENEALLAPLLLATAAATEEGGDGGGDGKGEEGGQQQLLPLPPPASVGGAMHLDGGNAGRGALRIKGKEEGAGVVGSIGSSGNHIPKGEEGVGGLDRIDNKGEEGGLEPRRRSTIVETAMLFAALVKQRVRTLAFCKVGGVVGVDIFIYICVCVCIHVRTYLP